MAMAKLTALVFVLVLVASALTTTTTALTKKKCPPNSAGPIPGRNYGPGSLRKSQCGKECERRCCNTQYYKACITYCNKCCVKCLCVPPGYYGNKQVCPCYSNWKTQEGGPKCP